MNGPQHFREAERLIDEANHVGHTDPTRGLGILVAAQVHATLALAAAQVEDMESTELRPGWAEIVDEEPSS